MVHSSTVKSNKVINAVEEEPPSKRVQRNETDEPPSSRVLLNRFKYFPQATDEQWCDWRWQFRNRIRSVQQLATLLPLSAQEQEQLRLVTLKYPLSITPYYFCLINFSDINDPIRKQAIPCFEEIALGHMGKEDPLAEGQDSVVPGLVHRYPDRVLLVVTDICAMLCRHCTRKREWHHGGWIRSIEEIEAMAGYIEKNRQIRDVIISGGDPLVLANSYLEKILSRLRRIKHVEILRIGSRFPVVLPQRIDDELCQMLGKYGPLWLNTHFNHPNELTPEAMAACDRLLRAGVPVNNQAVLLRGVNDSVKTQLKLGQALLRARVRPYYLFQCDEVQGTEHLRTPVETGIEIIQGMRGFTSGMAVPTYVIDLPGGGGKVALGPEYVIAQTNSQIILRNYEGRVFHYRNPKRHTQLKLLDGVVAAV